jgi:hypothetical protein
MALHLTAYTQSISLVRTSLVAKGWAKNSINAVIFRRNSVVSHEDRQYVAFYNQFGRVVLAARRLDSDDWEIHETRYSGDITDAHNSISIMVDGDGYLHMAWDHHNGPLRYCRSIKPGSIDLTGQLAMTGKKERRVTYPEFHRFEQGDLLFLYRDGESGRGDLVFNHYDVASSTWSQPHANLIDGEGRRNAYWQACIDRYGVVHLSWVWRESWNVATNNDLCYARSDDGGQTWLKSTGERYELPITRRSAEVAWPVPQRSGLINQTSMCADSQGNPVIATYWCPRDSSVPQYWVVYHDGSAWQKQQVSRRTSPFRLNGVGTKRIPISRPQVFSAFNGTTDKFYMLFRDLERYNRVSLASCDDLSARQWRITDLTAVSVGQWEPSYDTELWSKSGELHVFVQNMGQGDNERIENLDAQDVSILEWRPDTGPESYPDDSD